MQIQTLREGGTVRFELAGSFTFDAYRDFKAIYSPVLDAGDFECIDIELSGVEYLDSSALGMLLLLRERVNGKPITLLGAKGAVRSVLEIANFNNLFLVK